MNNRPTPDVFWEFAAKRQQIFFSKINPNVEFPDDDILRKYKFTNVYRATDRVSQYLIRNVIYNPLYSNKDVDVVFRILLFKIFNTISAWEVLTNAFQEDLTLEHFLSKFHYYVENISNAKKDGITIFTSAYMQSGSHKYGYQEKHTNHLVLIRELLKDYGVYAILNKDSMRELVEYFECWPLIGPFLAYQFAIDLNYSNVFNFDENDYVKPGNGCIRGLAKIYNLDFGAAKKRAPYLLQLMQLNQKEEFAKRGLKFLDLFGREMKLIDLQNISCESDKYCRVAFPEVESFGKSKIKHNYKPSTLGKIDYFFPPKWNLEVNINKENMK